MSWQVKTGGWPAEVAIDPALFSPRDGLGAALELFFEYRPDPLYSFGRFPDRRDRLMTVNFAIRYLSFFAVAALLVTAVSLKPLAAMGTDNPPAPTDDGSGKKKKKKSSNVIEQQAQQLAEEKFLRDYRAARAMILDGNYRGGIAAMHALGHDEHPDVANYVGYAYRKLGAYDDSRIWYEKALAADPRHVRTWSYYGMWHMEQGNRLKAEDFLQKVKLICGDTSCEEYRQLRAVIDGTATY
jgi:tetratricopeptide (TPR) repeat protein